MTPRAMFMKCEAIDSRVAIGASDGGRTPTIAPRRNSAEADEERDQRGDDLAARERRRHDADGDEGAGT